MNNRKTLGILQVTLVLGGVIGLFPAGCTSRTVPKERFQESSVLAAPSLSVALADPDNFSFAFVGDLHISGQNTERLRRILAAATAAGDAFVIFLGDIVDEGGLEDFKAVEAAVAAEGYTGKVLYVIGNHDIFGEGWGNYRDRLGPSHYNVTVGNSRFIAIDTADGSVSDSESDWLRQELAKPAPTNTFLLSHYAPVVPGVRTYLKLANEEEAARLMKLATITGVDAWLSGHHHSYVSEVIDGVTYTIAGGAGGRRMQPLEAFFFGRAQVRGEAVEYRYQLVE